MSLRVLPARLYYGIFGILIALTALTIWVAFIDLGPLNDVVALAVAVTKALLVILFFMHVKYNTRLTWLVVIGGFFWLGILLVMTLGDYLTRGWVGSV